MTPLASVSQDLVSAVSLRKRSAFTVLLLLRQEVKIELSAAADVDDFGKVAADIVGVAAEELRKRKGKLEEELCPSCGFAIDPGKPVEDDFSAGGDRVQNRSPVATEVREKAFYTRNQSRALFIGEGVGVDKRANRGICLAYAKGGGYGSRTSR